MISRSIGNLVHALLDRHVQLPDQKNKIALISEEKKYTYLDLHNFCLKIHSLIGSKDIKAGSKVFLLLENDFYAIGIFLGLIRAGRVPVYLNPGLLLHQYQSMLNLTSPVAVFYSAKIQEKVSSGNSNRFSDALNALDSVNR